MTTKISIVTPSFNQGRFIEETICSVLEQNYADLEYIIIDGGSTDNTVEIIKKYEKYLKYWVSESDNGQSHAINKGVLHCTGDIFNWLNSDDLLASDTLKIISQEFKDPMVDIVSGREIYFGKSREEIKYGSIIYPGLEQNLINGVIYQPSTFWRMNAIKPLFPVGEHFHYLMDTELWIRYIMQNGINKIKKVDPILAKFRLHEGSKTVGLPAQFLKERWELRWALMKEIIPDFEEFNEFFASRIDRNPLLDISMEVIKTDHQRIKSMIGDELGYEFYKEFDYSNLKKLLGVAWDEKIFTPQMLRYFIRLYLVPGILLRFWRNG